jgi:hypothetical protein
LGVTLDAVEQLENGRHPAPAFVAAVATVLQLQPGDIFDADGPHGGRGPASGKSAQRLISALQDNPRGLDDDRLQRVFDCDEAELRRMRRTARRLLAPAGLKLIVDQHRSNRLVSSVAPPERLGDGLGISRPARPLDADAIAVLFDVVHSARDRGWHDHPDPRVRSGVADLRAAGLLVLYEGRLRPSDPVIRSLSSPFWKTQAELAMRASREAPDAELGI